MYVITGGAGFIGSNVVHGLEAAAKGPLVVVDRMRDGDKWRNIAKRELFDIVHPDSLHGFLEAHKGEVNAVVHMGAISATTERDADLIVETNFRLSRDLWEWCAANDARLVYASSAATYGDGSQGFDDDGACNAMAQLRPLNAYGWSKLLFDRWVARRVKDGDPCPPAWAGLKFFNVYGPNEYHKGRMQSVVSQIYPKAVKGEACTLFKSHHPDYADGGQLRDFVWIGDCVDMVLWLLETDGVSGIYNCGSGNARSFADLAAAVYRALGKEPMIDFIPTPEDIRDKYQYFTEARMDRIKAAGFNARGTTLEDGVARYVREFLDNDDPYI